MRQRARTGLLIALAIVAGSAVLGLLGGLVWSEVAPRALLLEVSAGTAQVVNAETRAFMGADAWFCLITAAAGLLTGIVGCWLGIARRSPETRLAVTIGLMEAAGRFFDFTADMDQEGSLSVGFGLSTGNAQWVTVSRALKLDEINSLGRLHWPPLLGAVVFSALLMAAIAWIYQRKELDR